jgi:hypothetical protein
MRRSLGVVVLALLGAATTAAVATTTARGTGSIFRPGPQGVFVAVCGYSHRNDDDAIVFPNEAGRSHSHDYFGSTTANATSTLDSLRAGSTTCNFLGDTAAYWVPTLLAQGRPVEPLGSRVIYAKSTIGVVEPFAPGLRVIAGNSQARSPQSQRVTSWNCTAPGSALESEIPHCPVGSDLILQVNFPNCWNGVDLDSTDHKSHLTYSIERRCPASHPVAVPELRMMVQYPRSDGPVELSSGGPFSGHADFINSWDQRMLRTWVDIYLNRRRGR